MPFRGGLGGGVGGSVLCLGEPGVDSSVVDAVLSSIEGCGATELVSSGGVEMTPRAPSCSARRVDNVSLVSSMRGECRRREEIKEEIPQLR